MKRVVSVFSVLLLYFLCITCSGGGSSTGTPDSAERIVDASGGGDFRDIQSALNGASPGTVILVKNGTYRGKINIMTSGAPGNPITIANFPDHNPVIVPGTERGNRVEFNANYVVLEGFEIRGGYDGVKFYQGNNTIRNNYIHDNLYQGILIISTDNIVIESNTIAYNGVDPGECQFDGVSSPKHCHGIYMSDFECSGIDNIVIRNNYILGHGGRGIQWNGQGCQSKMTDTLVDGNLIENNSWGLALYYNVEGAVITNNIFIGDSRPNTDDVDWTFIGIWKSQDNTITNNEFHTSLPDFAAVQVYDSESEDSFVDNNIWRVAGTLWIWNGDKRSDWQNYRDITGWDLNSNICIGCG
ncbi:MAG: right-handed parallel beta-helix repeat-containing protein [Deltaproteobacteria bacterium]